MQTETQTSVYYPVQISRRGEYVAWGLALLVAAGWVLLSVTGRPVYRVIPILDVFQVILAASISLGNWMDRRTRLALDAEGLSFQNGLRDVRLSWPQVLEVRVWPTQLGKKVEVIGSQASNQAGERRHFQFRTLGKLQFRGEVRGQTGFEKGEEILRQIIQNSGLQVVEQNGDRYLYGHK